MALGTAIRYLKQGNWKRAHDIVQTDESAFGCWAHGIVHMMEGDIGNARYWYRRAGRPEAQDAFDAEWERLVTTFLGAG
jgi:hypothetical protein